MLIFRIMGIMREKYLNYNEITFQVFNLVCHRPIGEGSKTYTFPLTNDVFEKVMQEYEYKPGTAFNIAKKHRIDEESINGAADSE